MRSIVALIIVNIVLAENSVRAATLIYSGRLIDGHAHAFDVSAFERIVHRALLHGRIRLRDAVNDVRPSNVDGRLYHRSRSR